MSSVHLQSLIQQLSKTKHTKTFRKTENTPGRSAIRTSFDTHTHRRAQGRDGAYKDLPECTAERKERVGGKERLRGSVSMGERGLGGGGGGAWATPAAVAHWAR